MWSIVCFIDEDIIECVPNFWLKNSLCAWPNKDCKIKSQLAVEHRLATNSIEFGFSKPRLGLRLHLIIYKSNILSSNSESNVI